MAFRLISRSTKRVVDHQLRSYYIGILLRHKTEAKTREIVMFMTEQLSFDDFKRYFNCCPTNVVKFYNDLANRALFANMFADKSFISDVIENAAKLRAVDTIREIITEMNCGSSEEIHELTKFFGVPNAIKPNKKYKQHYMKAMQAAVNARDSDHLRSLLGLKFINANDCKSIQCPKQGLALSVVAVLLENKVEFAFLKKMDIEDEIGGSPEDPLSPVEERVLELLLDMKGPIEMILLFALRRVKNKNLLHKASQYKDEKTKMILSVSSDDMITGFGREK